MAITINVNGLRHAAEAAADTPPALRAARRVETSRPEARLKLKEDRDGDVCVLDFLEESPSLNPWS